MADQEEQELFEQLLSVAETGAGGVSQIAAAQAQCAKSSSASLEEAEQATASPGLCSGVSSESPSQHKKTTSWWAPVVKEHVKHLAWDPVDFKPVTLLSACAGSCAEAEVLKATLHLKLQLKLWDGVAK